MIEHIVKIMWNRKKTNLLLIVEFFTCFLVLFVALYMAAGMVNHYFKLISYSYQNTYHFSVNLPEIPADEQREITRRIQQELEAWTEIEKVSLTSNTVPFLEAGNRDERVQNQQFVSRAQRWEVDENFYKVLHLPVQSGKWFSANDASASTRAPIVITQAMKEEFFDNKNPLGSVITIDEKQYQVIGVTTNFNVGKWTYSQSGYFIPVSSNYSGVGPQHFLLKFNRAIRAAEYEKLRKYFREMKKNEKLIMNEGATLETYRKIEKRTSVLPVILISIVCGFLIINVIIGLFGILWQSIRYRRAEIGLRRAIGAASGDIYLQILGEVVILATFGIVPSCVIAFHFPLLHFLGFELVQSLYAMLASAGIIYVLVVLSALYPSKLAASIAPAEALHEN